MTEFTPELPQVIDSTMLVTLRSCERKFYLNHVLGLRSKNESQDLVAGGAFAEAVEVYRKLSFVDGADHDQCLIEAFKAFNKKWGTFEPTDDRNPKTKERTWGALEQYFTSAYPVKTDVCQPFVKTDGSPGIEFTFAIPLEHLPHHPVTGDPFILGGRFDMLGHYHNKLVVLDEKTTKQMGASWANQWELRNQFMTYCWACQQMGYDVDTAVVRGVCILKTKYNFAEALPTFGKHLLERFEQRLEHDVTRIVDCWNSGIFQYDFGDACTSYGGCQFRELCTAIDMAPWMAHYHQVRWNPLTRTEERREAA